MPALTCSPKTAKEPVVGLSTPIRTGSPPVPAAGVAWAADAGAAIVRVHDVREAADLLAVRAVLRGEAEVPPFDSEDDRLKWIRARG